MYHSLAVWFWRRVCVVTVALPLVPTVLADVLPTGEYTNDTVIRVPGFHGMEPSIKLSYGSRRGNGFMGVGWRLTAHSIIDRVSAFKGVARFDATDKYLLDGVELLPCSTGSGVASSPSCATARQAFRSDADFYAARWENYLRIRKGAPSAVEWTVWRKNGAKAIYRPLQETPRGTVRWAIASETDTHGNEVVYNYWCEQNNNQSECYPADIQYGPVAGTNLRANVVQFNWELRPDPWSHANGRLVTVNYRLKTIEVWRRLPDSTLTLIRGYALAYGAVSSASGRSLLRSIQEFGAGARVVGDGTIAGATLPPTVFVYDETAQGAIARTRLAPAPSVLNEWNNHIIPGDFNGDGRLDVVTAHRQFETWFNNGDGTFKLIKATDPVQFWATDCEVDDADPCLAPSKSCRRAVAASGYFSRARNSAITGDFDADGKTDFLLNIENRIETFFSKGDGNYRIADGPRLKLPETPGSVLVGDFNGDGKTDVLYANELFHTLTSNGDGSYADHTATAIPDYCRSAGRPRADACLSPDYVLTGDFNGDGLTDILSAGANFEVFLSNGDGAFTHTSMPTPAECRGFGAQASITPIGGSTRNHFFAGDFNGDGRTDFVVIGDTLPLRDGFYSFLSNGDGTFQVVKSAVPADACGTAGQCVAYNQLVVADLNGDGRTDFLTGGSRGVFDTWLARPDGGFVYTSSPTPDGLPAVSWMKWVESFSDDFCKVPSGENALHVLQGDFTGEGKAGFVSYDNSSLSLATFMADGGRTDLLTHIGNSLGGTIEISYAPSSRWLPGGLPAGVVFQNVRSIKLADGRPVTARPPGSQETFTYEYAGGHWSYMERMFVGYANVQIYDGAGNIRVISFEQAEDCVFHPAFIGVRSPDRWYAYTTYEYAGQTSPPYTCRLTRQKVCEANGGATCRWTSASYQWNEFGEMTGLSEDGRTNMSGDERYTRTEYYPNAAAYLVSLPARKTVYRVIARSASGATVMQRAVRARFVAARTRFVYDDNADENSPPTRGDLKQLAAWNNVTNTDAIASYQYDSSGNQTRSTDAAGYSHAIAYDGIYGVYPVQSCACPKDTASCNAHCTRTEWDPALGQRSAVIDSNQAITRFTYDALGRPVKTVQPDGGAIAWTYESIGDADRQRTRESRADGSPLGIWADTYMDGFGRQYRFARANGERYAVFSDSSALPSKVSDWYAADEHPVETEFTYDALRRIVRIALNRR
jgi:YD repeat-containing protein